MSISNPVSRDKFISQQTQNVTTPSTNYTVHYGPVLQGVQKFSSNVVQYPINISTATVPDVPHPRNGVTQYYAEISELDISIKKINANSIIRISGIVSGEYDSPYNGVYVMSRFNSAGTKTGEVGTPAALTNQQNGFMQPGIYNDNNNDSTAFTRSFVLIDNGANTTGLWTYRLRIYHSLNSLTFTFNRTTTDGGNGYERFTSQMFLEELCPVITPPVTALVDYNSYDRGSGGNVQGSDSRTQSWKQLQTMTLTGILVSIYRFNGANNNMAVTLTGPSVSLSFNVNPFGPGDATINFTSYNVSLVAGQVYTLGLQDSGGNWAWDYTNFVTGDFNGSRGYVQRIKVSGNATLSTYPVARLESIYSQPTSAQSPGVNFTNLYGPLVQSTCKYATKYVRYSALDSVTRNGTSVRYGDVLDLDCVIYKKFATSKIKITGSVFYEILAAWDVSFALLRLDSNLAFNGEVGTPPTATSGQGIGFAIGDYGLTIDFNSTPNQLSFVLLDTGASTVGKWTYRLRFFCYAAYAPRIFVLNGVAGNTNGVAYETGTSYIILEEYI